MIHLEHKPDCPECGAEAKAHKVITDVDDDGVLTLDYCWTCPKCAWESRHVPNMALFDELTHELTEGLRTAFSVVPTEHLRELERDSAPEGNARNVLSRLELEVLAGKEVRLFGFDYVPRPWLDAAEIAGAPR